MICITGDTHGDIDMEKLTVDRFPQQTLMTKDDYVAICGDAGLTWDGSKHTKHVLKELNARRFTTLFVDGNHENFDRLNAYPVTEWHGGKIHRIAPHVIHLMRGQVYEIAGFKIFTFGGGRSVDKIYRTESISWWPEEIPNHAEIEEAMTNLDKHNWEVDLVLTHTAPSRYCAALADYKMDDPVCPMLDEFESKLTFGEWFFGHFHADHAFPGGKFTAVFEKKIMLKVEE